MTKTPLTLAVLGLVLTPALASADMLGQLDANGDGAVTIDELQAAFPNVTADGFSEMDINDDGLLDADELTAAEDGEMLNADG